MRADNYPSFSTDPPRARISARNQQAIAQQSIRHDHGLPTAGGGARTPDTTLRTKLKTKRITGNMRNRNPHRRGMLVKTAHASIEIRADFHKHFHSQSQLRHPLWVCIL